ncbi:MAG: T9SS type A sorting domain-containing protein [Flavobacteriales bacterium]|nr:T9SS type A sorting domain-containing protein [Flavobacteriales bacterium]
MKQLLPLLLLFSISAQAQDHLHCGADEMRIQTLHANPKIAQAVIERDAQLEAFTREFALRQAQGTARGGQLYTIPVVFHVIHKYGTENISREQILDGMRILNETFRKTREDTADIHPDFKPIHADTGIEFALATKDPEGNCHSGINRIASELTNSGDHRVKELVHWDPSMYLNVYVVTNAAGLAGHCVWPADADTIPEWDGIVIAHSYVGTIGTSTLTRSVAFAHECGHYLNLHHIWGGNNVPNFYYLPVGQASNCDEDDLVDDTPNTIGWSNCNLNAASCGNVRDNVQNAMDYSYCNIMFTEGQKTRMLAALNSPIANRNNLWTPSNLAATGVMPRSGLCEADFEADNTFICNPNGGAVTFTNTSFHGEIDSVYWEFPGGDSPFSLLAEPIVVYYQPGIFDVSLTVYSNGQSEQVTKQNYIQVSADSSWSYPFWDWFEGNSDLEGMPWSENSLDADNRWELTEVASHSPSHSVWVDNWDNDAITVDELYGPSIDLSSASTMRLAFKYAFAGQTDATNDTKLQLQVSRNCETTWVTRLSIVGNSLETAPAQSEPFAPTIEQWQQEDIGIPSSYLEDGFRFRFVFTSAGNNRLFLDDINVDVTAGVEDSQRNAMDVSIHPNPAKEQLNVEFGLEEANELSFSIVDLMGKSVMEIRAQEFASGAHFQRLDLKTLPAGIYFLSIRSNSGQVTKRFIVL